MALQLSVITQNLDLSLQFAHGFKATLGLPDGLMPYQYPDVVELNSTSNVKFNMYFSEFTVCQMKFSPFGVSWIVSNPTSDDGVWKVQSTVDLRLNTYEASSGDDISTTAFSNLSKDVQDQIKKLGDDLFSIEQLLMDLSSVALSENVVIEGLDPQSDSYADVLKYFISGY